MFVYNYDEQIARLNKCLSKSKIIDKCVMITFLLTLVIGIIIIFFLPFDVLINFIMVGLCGFVINFVMIMWSVNHEMKYESTKYTAFIEENNTLYKIFAIGTNEEYKRKCIIDTYIILDALQEYKMGNGTVVLENGCALQIHEIKKIEMLQNKRKYWDCIYYDELNKKHWTKIGKVFNKNFNLEKFYKI